jgi:CheY-like chemotaxis protein
MLSHTASVAPVDDRHPRILLVEDHDATRRLLSNMLAREGCRIMSAASVQEGLALVDSEPDCLVLDLMLPDGPGETILRHVREANLRTRVVVCTATFDPPRLEAMEKLEPDAILQKPIQVQDILDACCPA